MSTLTLASSGGPPHPLGDGWMLIINAHICPVSTAAGHGLLWE